MLPFFPEIKKERVVNISRWTEKRYAEAYEREWLPKVEEILKPYLTTPITFKHYMLETTLCEHFEKAQVSRTARVAFYHGHTKLGDAALVKGVAQFKVSDLPTGKNHITALYF